jgi:acetoin utilization protein AcuB
MQVEQAMIRNVVTVTVTTTLAEAEELMRRGRFRHLPVVDGERVVGVVSERDVRAPHGLSAETADAFRGRPVGTVMHAPVIAVAPEDPVEMAAQLLHDNKIGCLPVLRDGALAGIITTSDVFQSFVRSVGMLEPSTRIEIRTSDIPATLRSIADVATAEHVAIAGLVMERPPGAGTRRLIVRFATLQGPRVIAALRAAGLDVAGPEPGMEG